MSDPDPIPSSRPSRPETPRAAHVLGYLLLAFVLVWGLISRPPFVVRAAAPIDPDLLRQVEVRIDPNTAGWAQLARLPDIGEVLAKRIVQYREQRRATSAGDAVVFRTPEDLDAVHGIGPKTVAAMRDYLRFPTSGR
jgi:hypothetical protein